MNRNTATKYVPAVNAVNGHHQHHHHHHTHHQTELKLTIPHFNVPSISTHALCLNGNGLGGSGGGTLNSLSSNASTNCGSGSGGSSGSVGGGGSGNGSTTSGGPLENLPKKFVSSMRTLFDIMDDKRSGFVRLSDIEARWQDDGSKGLPHGVIDCLRRVTPISGMLSFERFCAGLKICLLRNQTTNDCTAMTSTPTPATITAAKPIGSMGISAAAAATKLMMRRSSIDSLTSGNSTNSSNNHKVNSINHINKMNGNGNGHITSSTSMTVSNKNTAKAGAAVAVAPVNTVQHIKNIHLHMMNNGSDHNNSSIISDENNNDNNNGSHKSSNRKKNCLY